jgi:GDP-L-fucose synthase
MKTVLITGAGPTGVTGRAIREYLENDYSILAPSSKELDLTDDAAVRSYFDAHHIDFVVHCATYRSNISQTTHMVDEELESNLRMYFALASQSEKFEKMVYLGSGAEYDKSRPIVNIKEEQFGEKIPKNKYGLGKYIMNLHCRSSKNIYNLRMFGTLNPYERYTKNVVCNLCAKAVMGLPLTLKRDVLFSWVDIRDVAQAIKYLFEHEVSRHDYNIALSKPYKLSEIAGIIQDLSGLKQPVCFENEGLSNEYTCDTRYLIEDFKIEKTLINKSINDILLYMQNNRHSIIIDDIDNRWKK